MSCLSTTQNKVYSVRPSSRLGEFLIQHEQNPSRYLSHGPFLVLHLTMKTTMMKQSNDCLEMVTVASRPVFDVEKKIKNASSVVATVEEGGCAGPLSRRPMYRIRLPTVTNLYGKPFVHPSDVPQSHMLKSSGILKPKPHMPTLMLESTSNQHAMSCPNLKAHRWLSILL